MNSETSILSRLVESYPVKSLKHHFGVNGLRQTDLVKTVVGKNNSTALKDFAFDNFGYLHQHIYVLKSNKDIPNNWKPNTLSIYSNLTVNGKKVFNILYPVEYTVFNISQSTKETVIFYCPIKLKIDSKRRLILYINTLERNIKSYFVDDVFSMGKNIKEESIVENIIDSLPKGITLIDCDLNKGIKKLWDLDVIDAAYVKFKKSNSTSTEAMDENNTFKSKYPKDYLSILKSPIDRNIFNVINDPNDEFVRRFTIYPTKGKLSITRFPEALDEVDNLLNEILKYN